jgi:methylase of polypeptide subunit release factors
MAQIEILLKLRHNIDLEGDLTLAEMEIEALCGRTPSPVDNYGKEVNQRWSIFKNFSGAGSPLRYLRDEGVQGYILEVEYEDVAILVKRTSFLQNIYFSLPNSGNSRSLIERLKKDCGDVINAREEDEEIIVNCVPHYCLIELSDPVARRCNKRVSVPRKLDGLRRYLLGSATDEETLRFTKDAINVKNTTSHLSHDLHYYKAKFFPRLARSSLNVLDSELDVDRPRVVDNFVGSGTTLIESSILGFEGTGIDIDPLSVMISRAKIEALNTSPEKFEDKAQSVLSLLESAENGQTSLFSDHSIDSELPTIEFPDWLMKNTNMSEDKSDELISQINKVRKSIVGANLWDDIVIKTIFSDAVDRKIKLRFLGTGVGIFSLRFTKASIPERFSRSLKKYIRVIEAIDWLKRTIEIKLSESNVLHGDTTKLSSNVGSFDLLLTSPPYLPAASGRESYSKARAPSLISLGLEDSESVNNLIDGAIGAMSNGELDISSLTDDEKDLVNWLKNDDLREIKAAPTARYFIDMRETFHNMRELLEPGGIAILVSGKQSTFYEFESREELYVVESACLLSEEAKISGLEVYDTKDVKLKKANRNARPRSLDDYYETLIYLREPDK